MLLPSLSPLTWVNNAVNEAGGSGFGCCRQHAAGVVGNACLEVPVNMLGTAALPEPHGGLHWEGTVRNSFSSAV